MGVGSGVSLINTPIHGGCTAIEPAPPFKGFSTPPTFNYARMADKPDAFATKPSETAIRAFNSRFSGFLPRRTDRTEGLMGLKNGAPART